MKKHFFEAGKQKLVKSKVSGYVCLCRVCGKTAFEHTNWKEGFMRTARAIQRSEENYPIKKLPVRRGVQLSSTLSGQRELIREMRNKINEIIKYINEDYEKTK